MPKNDLTPEQIDDLKDLLVERMVDNMSTKDLVVYVTDDLTEYFKELTDKEFLRQAEDYWDDGFPEIVEEIKEDSNA
tara:strand:+ start:130 stop:360 length:231 start_codon:yes stop_codon:yes gene_type:complete